MSFFKLYNKLTVYLSVPGTIHKNFNSVSSPIYEQISKNDKTSLYFESLMFAFLELIFRKKDLKKFKTFSILFEDSLQYLKEKYFTSNDKVQKITNFDNFKEMKEDLLHYLRSYEILFFRTKEEEFKIDNLVKSRKKSQYRLHMILKLMLMSEIMQLCAYEKSKKSLEGFLKVIIEESFEEDHSLMNMLVATIFQSNIKIYTESNSSKNAVEFYKVQNENDVMNRLNLMKDKAGYYRILSDKSDLCAKQREEIYEKFEREKEELTKKLKSYMVHQKNLEKEIQILRRLYEHSKNMAVQITDGCKNYIDLLTEDKTKNKSMKFSTRKKFRESFRKIKSYERIMRKKNLPYINSDKLLKNIVNKIESMKQSMEEQNQEKKSQVTENDDNREFEDEDRLSLKLDKTPKNKSNDSPPQFFKKLQKKNSSEFDVDVGAIVLKKNTLIECLVCFEKKIIDDIRTFDCDCKICIECLKGYLVSRYERGKYDLDIPCFNSACNSPNPGVFPPISLHLVKEMLGQEALEKMQDFLVYKIADRKCANPDCNFRFQLNIEEANNEFFICEYCQHQTCLKCWNLRHPGKGCTRIDESLKRVYAGVMLRICPDCLSPATKDKACDQVTCTKCLLKFCFPCSVAQAPISAHGTHYHRKNCKNYHPWINSAQQEILVDEFDKKCSECVRLGKACQRPELTTKEFYEEKKVDQFFIDSLENDRDDDN